MSVRMRVAAVSVVAAWAMGVGHAQEPAFRVSYTQPMTFEKTVKVLLGFSGGPSVTPFVVDTGSVGIVVPRKELPEKVEEAVDGQIRYTSSGLVVVGFWTKALDVTLGESGAVAHVPVFAAMASHCMSEASHGCVEGSLPHMMGIGFGRPEAYATPDRNPLLHVKNLPKGRSANYMVTQDGLELGLRLPLAVPGMHTIQLKSSSREGLGGKAVVDFQTPPAEIRLNGGRPQMATVLIDTGITDALVSLEDEEPEECKPLPRKPGANCVIADGMKFHVSLLGGAEGLNFTLGDGGATTPSSGHWIHLNLDESSFMNTGIRALAKFKVFYDGTKGVFGLARVSVE